LQQSVSLTAFILCNLATEQKSMSAAYTNKAKKFVETNKSLLTSKLVHCLVFLRSRQCVMYWPNEFFLQRICLSFTDLLLHQYCLYVLWSVFSHNHAWDFHLTCSTNLQQLGEIIVTTFSKCGKELFTYQRLGQSANILTDEEPEVSNPHFLKFGK